MFKLQIFAILIIASSSLAIQGDTKPYCHEPKKYPNSLPLTQFDVDPAKFAGKWYDIATFSVSTAQAICMCSIGEYTLNDDGSLGIVNSCKVGFPWVAADFWVVGKGFTFDEHNNRFELYFQKPFKNKRPGSYFIMDLDPDYQWAVVGEPCRDNFWVLSRTLEMDEELLQSKLKFLEGAGYDMSKTQIRPRNRVCDKQ